ncbi:DUF2800 domain-containing protein [Thermanaerosceptrum fracticalcis]|uniref:DUF2800 domain-containing protein n=1 Tax=Thermanaerosceptrum fracticalcis TaxID=1712410 RepID=A0A7G6E7X8_THEFR|nr:DUF2800 domain-containing protein [Thermanaerosceptrum fracticalcis]QNB48182.1 DUF2800 domain-containing protein [Thermanaerosceptrum fracticalcis]
MSEQHALLSASSSHKWLICTPSARLEEKLPETKSEYAEEGRLAHAIAELKAKKHFTEPMGPKTFARKLKALQENPLYQEEMLRHTDTYLDYLSGIAHGFSAPPYIAIEKRLDYSTYAPEGFGTGDCIIIGGNVMHIIDFKYGKGVPVSAERNPQMMLYALGAYAAYSILYQIETVKMAIIQPRLDVISEYEMPLADLLAWGESIKPIAQKAFKGEGEFVSGEHCKFCRAKALCRARAEFNTSLEEYHGMKPPLITNEEVGAILVRAQNLATWVKDLEEYALAECLKGNEIPGWKAVEGRSVRQFTDQDEAFKVLVNAGYDEAILYERKPITLASVEKLLGKAKFKELLTEYVNTPPGKPTLAPESDKRQAITLQADPNEVFKNEIGGNENE